MFQRSRVRSCAVTRLGLQNSVSFHSSALWKLYGGAPTDAWDRALLVQCRGNLRGLQEARLELEEHIDFLSPGCFGENLFLDALSAESLCVGDELECWRDGAKEALRCQVASPRCPCFKVDKKLGALSTVGSCSYCMQLRRVTWNLAPYILAPYGSIYIYAYIVYGRIVL